MAADKRSLRFEIREQSMPTESLRARWLSHEYGRRINRDYSDNAQPRNPRCRRTAADDRVGYINMGVRLSMCDNYEFALQHALGERRSAEYLSTTRPQLYCSFRRLRSAGSIRPKAGIETNCRSDAGSSKYQPCSDSVARLNGQSNAAILSVWNIASTSDGFVPPTLCPCI